MKLNVCRGPHCAYRGADRVFESLKKIFTGQTDIAVGYAACAGFCEEGPNVTEDEAIIYHHAKPKDIGERIQKRDGIPLVAVTEENLNLEDDFLKL